MGDLHTPKFTGKPFSAAELLEGGAVGLIFDAGWQVAQDWGNPYLTPEQKGYRSLISSGVGFGATAAGGITAWGFTKIGAALGTTIEPGIGTAIGAVVGFGVGLWGELWLTPRIFEGTGNVSERHLSQLP